MGAREDYQAATIKSLARDTDVRDEFKSAYGEVKLELGNSQSASGVQFYKVPGEDKNLLDSYRSVNYNFTLAALSAADLKDPNTYRDSPLKYVIASSKGKGVNAISSDVVGLKTAIGSTSVDDEGNELSIINKEDGKSAVDVFNRESPGAFDLFVDNVEIESTVAPNEQTGASVGTKVRFEIYEPFSVNGFIEALHVAAIAAGWTGYLNASFLLKIDFLGYPDSNKEPVSTVEKIDATKYIVMKITGAEVEVTENGTRYRCTAIPYNEYAFSTPNTLYTNISFEGNTVGEVLKSLFQGINDSTKQREKDERGQSATGIVDQYEIYFPAMPGPGEALDIKSKKTNPIADAQINQFLKENSVYKFPPVEEKGTETDKRYDPVKNRISFTAGANIHDAITAIIRDSYYLKTILQDIEAAKKSNTGMIDYFQIMINTIPLNNVDKSSNQEKFIYQYVVVPYRVHYSKLPGQGFAKYDTKTLQPLVKRTYNYIYSGNNVDILNFKLNFNNLFFQAGNPKMGNTDDSGTSDAAAASGEPEVKRDPAAASEVKKGKLDGAPVNSNPEASSFAGRGGAIRSDPYYQLAYNAHQAILESVNLLTGEMEILGDPYFLCTSGMGNYLPKIKDDAITEDGEANFNNGPVLARINFRNPTDVDPNTGLLVFRDLAPFSGVYQVLNCNSSFREGVFKQRLKLVRYPGQYDSTVEFQTTTPAKNIPTEKSGETPAIDSAVPDVARSGVKPNELELTNLISRGLPTNGVPGALANIAGTVNQASALFTRVSGAIGAGATLLNQANSIGIPVGSALSGINPLARGIRLDAAAFANISNVVSGIPAAVNGISNIASSVLPGASANSISNSIGNNLLNRGNAIAGSAVNLGINLPGSGSDLLSSGKKLLDNSLSSVKNLGSAGAGLISGVGDKLASLTSGVPSIPGSPQAIAQKLGLDLGQLSGLTGGLDSKVISELKNVAEAVPDNVNLGAVKDQGILLSAINRDNIQNIPAIPPKLSAPDAELPMRSLPTELTPSQRSLIIAEASNRGIPVDQALRNPEAFLSNDMLGVRDIPTLPGVSAMSLPQGLPEVDSDILAGKLETVQSGVSSITGQSGSVESRLSAINNATGGSLPGSRDLSSSVVSKYGSVASENINITPQGGNAVLASRTVTTQDGFQVTYSSSGFAEKSVAPDGTTKYYDSLGNEIRRV